MWSCGLRRNSAPQDCPDYVSGGINSCFFDTKHTQIWEMYCMKVTAHTGTGSLTSPRHCLDVADIGDALHRTHTGITNLSF